MRSNDFTCAKSIGDIDRKTYKDRCEQLEDEWTSRCFMATIASSAYLTDYASHTTLALKKILAKSGLRAPRQGWWAPDSETNKSHQTSVLAFDIYSFTIVN